MEESAEAPPAVDEARRFRGSVPIGGHEVAGNRLTRRFYRQSRTKTHPIMPLLIYKK